MKRILSLVVPLTALAVFGLMTPAAARDGRKCSSATLNGRYSATITGTLGGEPFAELDLVTSAGNGTFTGNGTLSMNGTISTVSFTATYTVNSDCSGSASLSTGVTQNFNIKSDRSEVMFIATTPAPPSRGTRSRLSLLGLTKTRPNLIRGQASGPPNRPAQKPTPSGRSPLAFIHQGSAGRRFSGL